MKESRTAVKFCLSKERVVEGENRGSAGGGGTGGSMGFTIFYLDLYCWLHFCILTYSLIYIYIPDLFHVSVCNTCINEN